MITKENENIVVTVTLMEKDRLDFKLTEVNHKVAKPDVTNSC